MGGEIVNITKDEAKKAYSDYEDTMPSGIDDFQISRIEPLIYEIPPSSRVLDVGANSGEILKVLKESRNCIVSGIDLSEVAVAKAREKDVDVQVGDAENLPYEDHTFDVVLMLETLNHIHDPQKALQEAKRVLKPDGILLGSVPHKNLERYIWEDTRPHHPYFDVDSLGVLLDSVFKHSHLWPLKGAQFSVKFASTFLSGEPAEILFKCGSTGDDHKWWELMRKKVVLRVWFGPTQGEGDVYYRMRGFADKMRDHGVEAGYENFDYTNSDTQSMWQNRCRNKIVLNQLDAILKVADISIWQGVSHPDALAFLRCAKDVIKKPMVTDIDDWLLDVPQYNIASGPYKSNSPYEWYILQQLKLSDAVITSTEWLTAQLSQLTELHDKPFYVIKNSIDFAIWDKLQEPVIKKPEGVIRIGYSGCGNHGGDMYLIREPLKAILYEFPNVEFIWAVPMKDPHDPEKEVIIDHPRARCVNQWYTIKEFPQILKNWDLDIGIAPLVDNNFNRAKSNLRWLEYGALKLPCVSSAVEPFRKSILQNEDGRLCRGSAEWYQTLKELILSESERKRLGEAAYRRVKRDFNMEDVAVHYIEVLKEIKRHDAIRPRGRDIAVIERS